jgi:glycosyltransferase involved in cell wall biosynthesis
MKILCVANGTLFVGHQELAIASGLKEVGHEVTVLHDTTHGLFCNGWIPHPLVVSDIVKTIHGDYSVMPTLSKPDIILGVDQSVVPYVSNLKKMYGVPGFCIFLDFPVHVIDKNQPDFSPHYAARFEKYLEIGAELDSLIFISTVAADEYSKRTGRPCYKSFFVVSTLDLIGQTGMDMLLNRIPYVSSTHRFEEFKGSRYLIEALYEIDVNYKAVAVGGSKEKEHVALAKAFLGPRFDYYPKAPEPLKHRIVKASRLLVYPQCNPWMGAIAPLEAMALEVPTIVFDYPINREEYEDCTIYVPPKDVNSLTNAILSVLNHDINLKDMIAKGKKRVQEVFSPKASGERLTKIFEEFV